MPTLKDLVWNKLQVEIRVCNLLLDLRASHEYQSWKESLIWRWPLVMLKDSVMTSTIMKNIKHTGISKLFNSLAAGKIVRDFNCKIFYIVVAIGNKNSCATSDALYLYLSQKGNKNLNTPKTT